MDIALICFISMLALLWLWITAIALLCLFMDPELTGVQRWGQSLVVLLLPLLGAALILKLVNDHSPEVIARFYIPWPFKSMVTNKPLLSNGPGSHAEEAPGIHSGGHGGNP